MFDKHNECNSFEQPSFDVVVRESFLKDKEFVNSVTRKTTAEDPSNECDQSIRDTAVTSFMSSGAIPHELGSCLGL